MPGAEPAGGLQLWSGDGLTVRLETWAAAARIDEAAMARGRERWLLQLAEDEATLGGVLLDLAERRATAALRTRVGRSHTGAIEVVGADFVAIRIVSGVVLLPHASLTMVRPGPGARPVVGDRVVPSEVRFVEVVRELAADREQVRVVVDGGEVVSGTLHSVGVDVLALRADGDPPTTVHVPVTAVSEVGLG
jgi:hypothetical protein